MIICSCKGVTKDEIIKAVRKGAATMLDIQAITKATTGCGRCKSVVSGILSKELKKEQNRNAQLRIKFD